MACSQFGDRRISLWRLLSARHCAAVPDRRQFDAGIKRYLGPTYMAGPVRYFGIRPTFSSYPAYGGHRSRLAGSRLVRHIGMGVRIFPLRQNVRAVSVAFYLAGLVVRELP